MATQKRPLVNALVYHSVRGKILVTRANSTSRETNLWILPGGLPPSEIPHKYHLEFIENELQTHFPRMHLEPHPRFRGQVRAFIHYIPRREGDHRALHTHVYAFTTRDDPLSSGQQEARWVQPDELEGLGELTKKAIRSYVNEGLEIS